MISVKKSDNSGDLKFAGKYTLYVEGDGPNSIDPKILTELFKNTIRIEPLGSSSSIKSVAKALYKYHPTYFFLIDRDHYDDDYVNKCWKNFPDPDTHNLLVWRRREIENYFLDPEYLFTSQYCQVKKLATLKKNVLQFSKKRLFFDTANHVVKAVKQELKNNLIEIFSNPDEFKTKQMALKKLSSTNRFQKSSLIFKSITNNKELHKRFNERLNKMTGNQKTISFGKGSWLSMISGKEVLHQILNTNDFIVIGEDGKTLNGTKKFEAIIRDLLKSEESILPDDFKELRRLILGRLNK